MDFLPSFPILATFTAACLLLTITPGPDMTLFLGKTLTQGRMAGIAALIGASSGLLIHTFLAALGISALLAASATAFTILKIVGAIYLIWLAIQAIRNGTSVTLEAVATKQDPYFRIWMQAIGVNLLNPKIVLFFVTFLPQFVSVNDPNAHAKLLFLGIYYIVLSFPICVLMVLGAGAFARFLKSSPTAVRLFDWTFAGVMGSFAVKLLAAKASN